MTTSAVSPTRTPPEGAGLLANSNFRWLCLGSSVVALGNQFTLIALPWLVLAISRDPVSLGTVISLTGLSQVLLLLVGGALSDHYSAKTVSLLSCSGCALLLAMLAGAALAPNLQLWAIDVFALAWGATFAIAGPANMALVPQVLPQHLITAATSTLGSIRQLSGLVGPLLAGGLLAMPAASAGGDSLLAARVPFAVAFALDSLGFALVCVAIMKLRMPAPTYLRKRDNAFASILKGANWLREDRNVRAMLCYWMLTTLCLTGAFRVVVPLLADSESDNGSLSFGLFMAAYAAGGLLGMIALGLTQRWIGNSLGRTILIVDACAALIVTALGLLPATAANGLLLQTGLIAIWGSRSGFVEVGWLSWMQKRVPSPIVGRVMSAFMLVSLATVSLSAMAAGVLAEYTSIPMVFVCAGIATLLVAAIASASPRLRSIALAENAAEA